VFRPKNENDLSALEAEESGMRGMRGLVGGGRLAGRETGKPEVSLGGGGQTSKWSDLERKEQKER